MSSDFHTYNVTVQIETMHDLGPTLQEIEEAVQGALEDFLFIDKVHFVSARPEKVEEEDADTRS